eukprot:PITA_15225
MARIKYVPPNSSLRLRPKPEPTAWHVEFEAPPLKRQRVSKWTWVWLLPKGISIKWLKRREYTRRVAQSASLYLASVLQYLTYELLKLAGEFAGESQKSRIEPLHLLQAAKRNDQLSKLLGLSTGIADGGVVAHMDSEMWPRSPKPAETLSAAKPSD